MLHADHPDRIAVSAGGDAAAFIIGPTPGGPTKATGLWYGPLSGQPAKISDLVPDTNLAFAPHGPAFALAVQDGEGSRLVVVDPAAGQADWAEHRLPVFAEQVAWTADALIVLAADPGADTASLTSGKPLAGGAEDPVVARAAGVARCVEDGIADPGRVAAMGASYGGYLTAWAIAGGTPFRCGVVIAGMSDLVSCWGTANNAPFYDYLLQGGHGCCAGSGLTWGRRHEVRPAPAQLRRPGRSGLRRRPGHAGRGGRLGRLLPLGSRGQERGRLPHVRSVDRPGRGRGGHAADADRAAHHAAVEAPAVDRGPPGRYP